MPVKRDYKQREKSPFQTRDSAKASFIKRK